MRKLIYAINSSLDGCVDHSKFGPDEETFAYVTQLTRNAGAFLYGRITYQLMVPYWQDVLKNPAGESKTHLEFARAFEAVEKIVVFSHTLNSAEGRKAKIVHTGLSDEILQLKQEPGKYILTGGVSIPTQLAELGLIDEFHILVHPVVVGEGRRLFDGISLKENLRLKLVNSTIFKSGTVAFHYLKQ